MFSWHHRWNVLAFAIFSQAIVTGIYVYSFAFLVVPWIDKFKVPRSQIMLIATVGLLACGFASSFGGVALDKYRARWVLCSAGILYAAGLVLVSVSKSHWESCWSTVRC